jgi:hypothetical protein
VKFLLWMIALICLFNGAFGWALFLFVMGIVLDDD